MRWSDLTIRQKHIAWACAFLALPVLFYTIIRFYPTANAILISFQDWNLLGDRTWAGLDNYIKLFSDPVFWKVFRNTFLYLLIGTPISLVISFFIAYHLDKTRFMHGFLRMLYFLPFMTSAVAMAWVWRWFYQPAPTGAINSFLGQIGLAQIDFLKSTTWALPSIMVTAIWAGLGFQIIIFLAGLRAIPTTYYEAARIDGLGEGAILRRITLPLLMPNLLVVVVLPLALWLAVLAPLHERRAAAQSALQEARALHGWVAARAAEMTALDTGESTGPSAPIGLSALEQSLVSAGLRGAVSGLANSSGGGIELRFDAVEFTALMGWLSAQDPGWGYDIASLRLMRGDEAGLTAAEMLLRPQG